MEGTGTLNKIDIHMLCQVMRGADVADIYSPERVNKVAKEMGRVNGIIDGLVNWMGLQD